MLAHLGFGPLGPLQRRPPALGDGSPRLETIEARRMLSEAAWSYHVPPLVSADLLLQQEGRLS